MKLSEIKTIEIEADEAVRKVYQLMTGQSKPVCMLMIGMPASGKSTFLRKLESLINQDDNVMLPIESVDDQAEIAAKKLGLNYTDFMDQNYSKVISGYLNNIDNNIQKYTEEGVGFIVDQTLLTKQFRNNRMKNAQNFFKIGISFEIERGELDRRLKDRHEKTGKSIPTDVLDRMRGQYERPSILEGFDELIFIKK